MKKCENCGEPNDGLKWKSVEENGFNLEVWFEKDIKKYEMEYMV